MSQEDSVHIGLAGEDVACQHLTAKGYTIIDRNWRSGRYEIDIIARDGDTMVFCEVKTARSNRFGSAIGWVTPGKIRRIAVTAMDYINTNRITGCGFRFDVIGLDISGNDITVTHIENAFDAPGSL